MLYKIKTIIKSTACNIDNLWIYFWFIVMCKSMLFLSMLHTHNASSINIRKMYFSAPPILSHMLMIAALLSFAFLLSGSSRFIYYILVDLIVTALLLGDLWYYRTNGNFLGLRFILFKELINPMNRKVIDILPIDLIFVSDFIMYAIVIFKRKHKFNFDRNIKAFSIILLVSITHISISHYLIDKADITKGTMMMFKRSWAPFQTMSNLSPIGYHIFDIYSELKDNKEVKLSKEDMLQIEDWFLKKQENLPDNEYKNMFKGKNLIVLQVESLENFVIGQSVYGQEITPNINKLIKSSLYFNNIYEQNNVGTSSDADLLINTSLYPVREGATFFKYPYRTYNSLPKLLKESGYNTISTHPEIGGNWNWSEVHRASFEFEKILDINSYNKDELIRGYISDGSLLNQFLGKLTNMSQPFYSFLVTMSSHGPFDLEKEYKFLRLSPELQDTILGDYFQSMAYVDKQIGDFIEKLKKEGMLENSVVMIYGDHTGVHKFYNDRLLDIKLNGDWWKKDDKKIPLIIYNPEIKARTIDMIGGHIDIMPTILYMFGVEEKRISNSTMGKILVKTNKNFTVLNNGEIIGISYSNKEKEHMLKGIDISDKIIRGNYFKHK